MEKLSDIEYMKEESRRVAVLFLSFTQHIVSFLRDPSAQVFFKSYCNRMNSNLLRLRSVISLDNPCVFNAEHVEVGKNEYMSQEAQSALRTISNDVIDDVNELTEVSDLVF